MQPYYFPYLGHFALIANCDQWVVFDITQFKRKSWMTRNRVLHPREGWNYISVSLENASISIKTSDARILSFDGTAKNLPGKLAHYRRKAPFWHQVERLVSEVFAKSTDSLVELNVNTLDAVCRYLDIPFHPVIASRSIRDLPAIDHPGGWAPAICTRLGASEYLNPIGGRTIFSGADFKAVDIRLKFLDFEPMRYATGPWRFEESLSILDVLMWNSPQAVRQAIATHSRVVDAGEAATLGNAQNA